jgi:hypothetical protein
LSDAKLLTSRQRRFAEEADIRLRCDAFSFDGLSLDRTASHSGHWPELADLTIAHVISGYAE